MSFNSNFYQPNLSYTREMAEARLTQMKIKDFTFKSSCYSNGASFYFETKDGIEIRVSDHPLTGNRAFNTIQISIVEPKSFPTRKPIYR